MTVKRTSRLNEPRIAGVLNRLHERADAHDSVVIPDVLVVADDILLLPDLCAEYLEYLRGATESYVSVDLPIDDGLEVSVFLG